jgi:hypothetical protein
MISNPEGGAELSQFGFRHIGRSVLTISTTSCGKLSASFLAGTMTDKKGKGPAPEA